jgi:hypothetical protein
MNSGLCRGGPLDGQSAVSRFPKGFLLVDKPAGECWIYEWDEENNEFIVRDEDPMLAMTEGPVNRYRAAEEPNYDVLAAPWAGVS